MNTDTSIPEMLPPILEDIQTSYPERSIKEARRVYGPQLTTAFHPLRYLLQGSFPTADVARWYQANQMVCSGTTPAGTAADFGERHGSWSKRVKEQKTEYVERSLEEILVYTPLVSTYLSHTLVPHLTYSCPPSHSHTTLPAQQYSRNVFCFCVVAELIQANR
jgi:hypothetical protein